MALPFVRVNGRGVASLVLCVPNEGVWFAEIDIANDEPLTGAATIAIGESTLVGVVDDTASGTYGLQRRARVLGGAGGWRKDLLAKGYPPNDAGIKAAIVATDTATAAGETIGVFAGGAEKLGNRYLREAGPASRTIEDVARGVPWWVDYAGVTQVGIRAVTTPKTSAYDVVSFDPRQSNIVLRVDDLTAVGVGSTITKGLDTPLTITSFELDVTPEGLRMRAWCGQGRQSALARSLRAIVERSTDQRITWPVRYRVVQVSGDRVDLQVVKKSSGAPDALSVPLWPGIAGAHITSAAGAEVIVQFVDGDRADPIVTNFAGRGAPGAIPERLTLGAASGAGQDAARKGDTVQVPLPPLVLNGTALIAGIPTVITGVLTAPVLYTLGIITTGAPGVGIGSDSGS